MKIRLAVISVAMLLGAACSDDVEEAPPAPEAAKLEVAATAAPETPSVDEKITERLIELLKRRNLHGRHAVSRLQ